MADFNVEKIKTNMAVLFCPYPNIINNNNLCCFNNDHQQNNNNNNNNILSYSYYYQDRSNYLPEEALKHSKKKKFPSKLHMMLENVEKDGLSSIVSWQPHGRCFVVHKQQEFINIVIPKYFRQTKFPSFQRQLNLYGFSRLTNGLDKGGYYHEMFLRGRRFLCHRMQRMKVKGTGVRVASNPNTEPNFYAMPPVLPTYGKKNHQSIDKDDEKVQSPKRINKNIKMGPQNFLRSATRNTNNKKKNNQTMMSDKIFAASSKKKKKDGDSHIKSVNLSSINNHHRVCHHQKNVSVEEALIDEQNNTTTTTIIDDCDLDDLFFDNEDNEDTFGQFSGTDDDNNNMNDELLLKDGEDLIFCESLIG